MKTNNMLIALYFVISVVLLSLTRHMAGGEPELVAGEQSTGRDIISHHETNGNAKKQKSYSFKNKQRITTNETGQKRNDP